MDDLLPSYESVIQQDPWELIAPYLHSADLCSAALVCQRWHEIFTPQLWGNPASHFGVENDTVYVALTRFKRTLYWARLYVRELTHTLHLPPAHAEIYGGPHAEWLRDCLERLPRLQCLIANGLPFFDHASLLTLRHSSLWARSFRPSTFPIFGLRLLDASGCTNATSTGLAEALSHFPDLISLDLSRTLAAKDETVFTKLRYLRSLRVLKLRGLGIKDADFSTIAKSIKTRVRSLDISENSLTDASARLLLEECLKETTYESHSSRAPLSPVANTRPRAEMDVFGTEDLDNHLRRKLTQGFVGSLAVEDARDIGITHLSISRNCITVEAVSGLLRSRRLQVLDIGTLPTVFQQPRHPSSGESEDIMLPGVEKLTPVLTECASEKLVYLRMNYQVVTEDTPTDTSPFPRAEMSGDNIPCIPLDAHELDAAESQTNELESTTTAIFELPGDSKHSAELPDSSPSIEHSGQSDHITGTIAPAIEITSERRESKRDLANAPEPISSPPFLSPISPLFDSSGRLSPNTVSIAEGTIPTAVSNIDSLHSPRSRHNSMHYVEGRRAGLDLRQSQEACLHPGHLPNLHTLVLTDVPTKTSDRKIIDRLIQFIKDCAEETEIARLRARYTYVLPPGRSRYVAEREYAQSIFSLRRIVLEMAPPKVAPQKISTSWRAYPTKSSTEDADSEAFWEAATHDFSFFGDEECGLPSAEPGRPLPLVAMSGLQIAPKRPAPPPKPRLPLSEPNPWLDVVSELGRFRMDRKAAYSSALHLGETEPSVEGYWPGDITIVRRSVGPGTSDVDYYGNRYELGYLYR